METIFLSIDCSALPKEQMKQGKNGHWYITLCVNERKQIGQFGETHTVSLYNGKKESEAKTPTVFVGSGRQKQTEKTEKQKTVEMLVEKFDLQQTPNVPF